MIFMFFVHFHQSMYLQKICRQKIKQLIQTVLLSSFKIQYKTGYQNHLSHFHIQFNQVVCLFYKQYKNITNNMDPEQEQEQVRDPDADLPPFRVRHNDMKLELVKKIVRKTTELIRQQKKKPDVMLEKDVCLKVVQYLRSNKAQFGSGQGEWQCIIGKNLAATLNYQLHMLTFIDLLQFGYSVLVFKSG